MSLNVNLCSACSLYVKLHSVFSLLQKFFSHNVFQKCHFFLSGSKNKPPIFANFPLKLFVADMFHPLYSQHSFVEQYYYCFKSLLYMWNDSTTFIWIWLYFLPTKVSSPQQSHSVTLCIDGFLGVMQGE